VAAVAKDLELEGRRCLWEQAKSAFINGWWRPVGQRWRWKSGGGMGGLDPVGQG
jgi:hypothetical protein